MEEGKEVATVKEVEEKACERDIRDSHEKDGDLKEEEKKRDQELTRIGCLCCCKSGPNV